MNFVLTTRNAEGQQCYEKRDRVTAEIKNHQGHDCATEVRVQDKKDGSYKISYFAKESVRCETVVKVNEEQSSRQSISGSSETKTIQTRAIFWTFRFVWWNVIQTMGSGSK